MLQVLTPYQAAKLQLLAAPYNINIEALYKISAHLRFSPAYGHIVHVNECLMLANDTQ